MKIMAYLTINKYYANIISFSIQQPGQYCLIIIILSNHLSSLIVVDETKDKQMRKKVRIGYKKLFSFILSMLGIGATFSACEWNAPMEYGTPHARFKVNGKVTDKMNKEIQGVKVIMQYDTVYTNNLGNYEINTSDFPSSKNFPISFEDVDGSTNGLYVKMDTIVAFVDPEFINGDGHWYSGETSEEFNIQLKEEK